MSHWSVYLIRSGEGLIYTGIATDVARRLGKHRSGRGAKYLRGRGPLVLIYQRQLGSRSLALRVEHRLKRLTKAQKEAIVRSGSTRQRLLTVLRLAD